MCLPKSAFEALRMIQEVDAARYILAGDDMDAQKAQDIKNRLQHNQDRLRELMPWSDWIHQSLYRSAVPVPEITEDMLPALLAPYINEILANFNSLNMH